MGDRFLSSLTQSEAERIVESLRLGVPPTGHAAEFTVGRRAELGILKKSLGGAERGSGRLLLADYGAGKSHLLKVIRELALQRGHVVAFVTMDAFNGVRGNRMDQILAAVCDEIELPGGTSRGLSTLFRSAADQAVDVDLHLRADYWLRVDTSNCESRARYFQAGYFFKYRSDRQRFYSKCARALSDLDGLAKACGFEGFVLLIDEFEDVVTNLVRADYRAAAIDNLLGFFDPNRFAGLSFFAVTPNFTHPWRWGWLGAAKSISQLPTFALTPPTPRDVKRLARMIRSTHDRAYGTEPADSLSDSELDEVALAQLSASSEDHVRQTVEGIVRALDASVE